MSINLLLADSQALFTAGLKALLENESDVDVVGTAQNGEQAVAVALRTKPDVVLSDFELPDMPAAEVTRRILAARPETRVLCVSGRRERDAVLSMLDAGAAGYVLKDCSIDDLLRAIRACGSGKSYLSDAVAGYVVKAYRRRDQEKPGARLLTRREQEILTLVADGLTSKDIASRLGIAPKTAKNHRENIMRKLDLHSVSALTGRIEATARLPWAASQSNVLAPPQLLCGRPAPTRPVGA